jgi:hypothetical protein
MVNDLSHNPWSTPLLLVKGSVILAMRHGGEAPREKRDLPGHVVVLNGVRTALSEPAGRVVSRLDSLSENPHPKRLADRPGVSKF